ncbi:MAG: hypothetical protein ACFCVA_13225 [Gammaproteobacteria bacterium]
MYTPVVTRPILGARPFGASLTLFKIVPDDFVATVRLALPALVTFLKQLLIDNGTGTITVITVQCQCRKARLDHSPAAGLALSNWEC